VKGEVQKAPERRFSQVLSWMSSIQKRIKLGFFDPSEQVSTLFTPYNPHLYHDYSHRKGQGMVERTDRERDRFLPRNGI
jgi:hypothetical protein